MTIDPQPTSVPNPDFSRVAYNGLILNDRDVQWCLAALRSLAKTIAFGGDEIQDVMRRLDAYLTSKGLQGLHQGSRKVAFGEAPPTPGTPDVDKTLRCCPFCGSGDIIGNSDKTVTCGFCSNRFQIILESPHPFMPSALDGVPGPEIVGPDGTSPLEGGNGIGAIPNDPNAPGADPMDPNAPPEVEGEGGLEGFRTDQPAQAGATLEQFRVARMAVAAQYLTPDGALPEDAYLRHLALRFADDRDAVLPQIRQEHGAK